MTMAPPQTRLKSTPSVITHEQPVDTKSPSAPWQWPISPRLAVVMLTLVGLGIRLIIVRGFWLDEATSGYDARQSYSEMLRLLRHDNHPPLDYSILWAVAHTVGSSEFDLRAPSIIFGTLLIPMLYIAGKALYHERAGVLAAAFGTVGALSVWYAQEARMYALFMLLATVTIWAQARALKDPRVRYWVIWAVAGAAMIWTQWFAALAVGTEILVFAAVFVSRWQRGGPARRFGWSLLGSTSAIFLICLPGVPLLLTQFHNNQTNGLGLTTSGASASPYGIFNNLVWALWGYHSNGVVAGVVAVWPIGIVIALVLLGRRRHHSNLQLLALIIVPMSIVFVASALAAQGRSLFEIRYFIEAVPALYLLLAGSAWSITPTAFARRIFIGLLLSTLVLGLVLQQSDGDNPRLYGYTWAFDQINATARPGDEILYDPVYLNVDVAYLSPHVLAEPLTSKVPKLAASARLYVVGSFPFSGGGSAKALAEREVAAISVHRPLVKILHAPNVIVWEFS